MVSTDGQQPTRTAHQNSRMPPARSSLRPWRSEVGLRGSENFRLEDVGFGDFPAQNVSNPRGAVQNYSAVNWS